MKDYRAIRRGITARSARPNCALALFVFIAISFPLSAPVRAATSRQQSSQTDPPAVPSQAPSHNIAPRIKLITLVPTEIAVAEPITSVIVMDPAIAKVEVKGERSILITGLMTGDTILIISGKNSRLTYAIDVERHPEVKRPKGDAQRAQAVQTFSGSNSIYFTPGSNGAPSLMRESFDYTQKLSNDRTLRMGGDVFRFFGGGDRALTSQPVAAFGTSRLKFGLDSPTIRLDLLDSTLDFSQLGFSGYLLRGPHFVSTRDSRWRGLELFAGDASPRLTLFDHGQGRIAGALMPVLQTKSLRIRTGFFFISPSRVLTTLANATVPGGGFVLHSDVRYTPDDRTNVEGEAAYSNGGLSWRGKLDLRRGAFNFLGELSTLDRRSPMTAIGAQSGARKTEAFNLQWQPVTRFSASAAYYRTTTVPPDVTRIQLNNTAYLVSATLRPATSASLTVSLNQQVIEAPAGTLGSFLFNLQTRTATIKYDQRLGRRWSNDLEARLILSREEKTNAEVSQGLILREQLRFAWLHGSITGFGNYRSNTPSLESLIIRNPALLPVELRAAFAADPVRFLLTNRDALPLLLSGVQLPLTQNTEGGVRFQSAISRLNLNGEVVYSSGKFIATEQRTLLTSLSAIISLDRANSLQFSIARGFAFSGTGTHMTLTAGYVHRFGSGSGGGFQFPRLLGFDRGHIQGRVFGDSNANGQEDPGEIGIAGMTVRIDDRRSVVTDSQGYFSFGSVNPGEFDVALISDDLGVKLRASKPTVEHVLLLARHTINLSFGVTDGGFASGRVFNDLLLTGEQSAGDSPGIVGVRVNLDSVASVPRISHLTQLVDGNGLYEFRNLRPGAYLLGIDTATLPTNFRVPAQTQWPITVNASQGVYLDLPLAAQRAVSGVVYMDLDGDGKYTSGTDTPIPGASVRIGRAEAITDENGSYILRNVVAGTLEIRAETNRGYASRTVRIELSPLPGILQAIDLAIAPSQSAGPAPAAVPECIVSGTVYMDFDGDGKFSPGNDTRIPGAMVRMGRWEAITDSNGSYVLHCNAAAGRAEIYATTSRGYASGSLTIDLPQAHILRDVNLALNKSASGN